MRTRVDAVTPWLDIFDLAQLLMWMLDIKPAKHHWQRPIHWKYAAYDDRIPEETQRAIRAFTAACSNPTTGPSDGAQAANLLDNLFPQQPPTSDAKFNPRGLIAAKRRGESNKLLTNAAIAEEVEAAAPLAERVYGDLKAMLAGVLDELSAHETSTSTLVDGPFDYRIVGATDLYWVSVGPSASNIQLRLKSKVVPWSEPLPGQRSNRDHWQTTHAEGCDLFCFRVGGAGSFRLITPGTSPAGGSRLDAMARYICTLSRQRLDAMGITILADPWRGLEPLLPLMTFGSSRSRSSPTRTTGSMSPLTIHEAGSRRQPMRGSPAASAPAPSPTTSEPGRFKDACCGIFRPARPHHATSSPSPHPWSDPPAHHHHELSLRVRRHS